MSGIEGGIVVVTGAAGALGSAVVRRLARDGAAVVALDFAETEKLPTAAAFALGGVDLSNALATVQAFEAIGERFGSIRALINVAGGFAWETIADGSAETWDRLYNLNVRTALNASKAALDLLADGGAIVNVGAGAAARADAGMGAYAASKAGVARLTEALAAELRERRIRVNAVLPSIIDTPANRADMPKADFGKWVTTDELANTIAFLVSGEASGITGASVPVSGRV